MTENFDKTAVVAPLNKILELELAGVVRYTHYALMIYGYNRIPIVSWMQQQADESMTHARQAGEMITHLGEHPAYSEDDLGRSGVNIGRRVTPLEGDRQAGRC